MAISSTQLVFSVSAVRRILGVASSVVVNIKFWWSGVIWVHVAGRRPTFMSRKSFYAHFADRRKAEGRKLFEGGKVTHHHDPKVFSVDSNGAARGYYYQDCQPDRITCECEDYKNQAKAGKGACCKHGYGVLAALGFGSIKDYCAVMIPVAVKAEYKPQFPTAGERRGGRSIE